MKRSSSFNRFGGVNYLSLQYKLFNIKQMNELLLLFSQLLATVGEKEKKSECPSR